MKTRAQNGFTLVEMLISMTVFVMMVGCLISVMLFGLRQNERILSKAGACEQARNALTLLNGDIRGAQNLWVGNATAGASPVFTPIPLGTNQQGNALKICLSHNSTNCILYYFDTTLATNNLLRRWQGGKTAVISQFLTNSMRFNAELPDGTPQTNWSPKAVIHVYMEYWQVQYPITTIGPGNYYDYYRTEAKIAARVPVGQ